MTPEETKAALKEALKEWMDERFSTFGRWSAGTLAVAVLGAAIYLILISRGWSPPV